MTQPNTAVHVPSKPLTLPVSGSTQVTAMLAGYYLVQFPPFVRPSQHAVRKDKSCACLLGAACPAVEAVSEYLRNGGQRAPDPKPFSLIPPACPICGGPVHFEPALCSPARGAGWVCLQSARSETMHWPSRFWRPGEKHYWQFMWAELGRLHFGPHPGHPGR